MAAEVEVAPGYNQTRFENIYKLPEGKKEKILLLVCVAIKHRVIGHRMVFIQLT